MCWNQEVKCNNSKCNTLKLDWSAHTHTSAEAAAQDGVKPRAAWPGAVGFNWPHSCQVTRGCGYKQSTNVFPRNINRSWCSEQTRKQQVPRLPCHTALGTLCSSQCHSLWGTSKLGGHLTESEWPGEWATREARNEPRNLAGQPERSLKSGSPAFVWP
jgi:hypothetical protein